MLCTGMYLRIQCTWDVASSLEKYRPTDASTDAVVATAIIIKDPKECERDIDNKCTSLIIDIVNS